MKEGFPAHCTDEELILLLDQDADDAMLLHLRTCPLCASRLRALQTGDAAWRSLLQSDQFTDDEASLLPRTFNDVRQRSIQERRRIALRSSWRVAAMLALGIGVVSVGAAQAGLLDRGLQVVGALFGVGTSAQSPQGQPGHSEPVHSTYGVASVRFGMPVDQPIFVEFAASQQSGVLRVEISDVEQAELHVLGRERVPLLVLPAGVRIANEPVHTGSFLLRTPAGAQQQLRVLIDGVVVLDMTSIEAAGRIGDEIPLNLRNQPLQGR